MKYRIKLETVTNRERVLQFLQDGNSLSLEEAVALMDSKPEWLVEKDEYHRICRTLGLGAVLAIWEIPDAASEGSCTSSTHTVTTPTRLFSTDQTPTP
jgi:hypothetical protein